MPELKAVGNPTGANQYTPEEERNFDVKQHSKNQGGNSSEYRTRKLKRDYPEVFERMLAGEFTTVTEAEEAAGIKKQSDRWNAPGPVEKLAALIRKRYGEQAIFRKEKTGRKLQSHGTNRFTVDRDRPDDCKVYGNNADYLLGRIERDYPDTTI